MRQEAIEAYRQIMELMTPDVIAVPHVTVSLKSQPGEVYRQLRVIADEYAKRMDWGWEETSVGLWDLSYWRLCLGSRICKRFNMLDLTAT